MKPTITYIEDDQDVSNTDAESQKLRINLEQKDRSYYNINNDGRLDITGLALEVDISNIDQYENEQYALLRKNGLGTSDSSSILGVNPYTTREELIAEKARNYLTPEERAVGDKSAVKKGRDLEPLIISKFEPYIGNKIIKPIDMYRHTEFPYIKFNFDGVIDKNNNKNQYIPCEIKVVTMYGEKHYDKSKAWFDELNGFGVLPENVSGHNWSIETKAGFYGIPPYYYTQLQQQILGLDAPFGYLTVLFDKSWEVYSYFVWKDEAVHSALVVEGYKVWSEILKRRGPSWHLPDGMDTISTER